MIAEANSDRVCTCVGCGCTDVRGCLEPSGRMCRWLRVDRGRGMGVCSRCAELVQGWDMIEREMSEGPSVLKLPSSRRKHFRRLWGVRHVRWWLYARELADWWTHYEGPGVCINPADLAFLDAVWRGEA